MRNATIHVAAPPQLGGLHQACSRCGHVLQDYTGGQLMVPDGQDTTIPTWAEGRRVGVADNATWTMADDEPLDLDETECKAAQ